MDRYDVVFTITATTHVEVLAASPEDAKRCGRAALHDPRLCAHWGDCFHSERPLTLVGIGSITDVVLLPSTDNLP